MDVFIIEQIVPKIDRKEEKKNNANNIQNIKGRHCQFL